tara:strand:+ start:83 stop:214 length:132 start_codon:yes stop_codon:yes gene_type:complete
MVQGMFGLERGIKVESQRQVNQVKTESVEAEEVMMIMMMLLLL